MAIKPMLFNTEMVRAILSGQKTCTRRINKDGSEYSVPDMTFFDADSRTYGVRNYADKMLAQQCSLAQAPVPICPGDILYVRETWKRVCASEDFYEHGDIVGSDEVFGYRYRADNGLVWDEREPRDNEFFASTITEELVWHPSIHMPKEAARIFLRVTGVRVERLQDCGNMQAKDEGCTCCSQFARLWDSTIKPADLGRYGWAVNPWVWVIEFERISKEAALGGGAT